jgi:hypothetical protein
MLVHAIATMLVRVIVTMLVRVYVIIVLVKAMQLVHVIVIM